MSSLMIILTSYVFIFITVLKMPSTRGDATKPSLPVLPTWLPLPSSTGPSFPFTVFLTPEVHGSWSKWPLSFTQWSSPCWTQWSTALGTKMWKRLLGSCCCCCCVASVVSDSVQPHKRQPTRPPIPGILQARTLEWVAISFSNAWKWKVKVKLLSHVRL